MTQDKRLWAKLDLGYFSNPKVSDVLDASSNAVLMHVASILHCAQHLTDGHVAPRAMQRAVGGTDEDTQLLVQNGLWHEPGHNCEDCPQPDSNRVYVHDYLQHNTSSDKVERRSASARKAAQARWAKAKDTTTRTAPSTANSNAERMHNAQQHAVQDAMPVDMQDAMLDREIDRSDQIEEEPPQHVADATVQHSEELDREDVQQVLDVIDAHCDHHGFKKPSRTKRNIAAARLMLDTDQRSVDDIITVMRFVTMDDFWPDKIRSAAKLRTQFDQLKYQAQKHNSPAAITGTQYARPTPSDRARSTLALGEQLANEWPQPNTTNVYAMPRSQQL